MKDFVDIKKISSKGYYFDSSFYVYISYRILFGSGKIMYFLFDNLDRKVCSFSTLNSMRAWLTRNGFRPFSVSVDTI